MSDSHALVCSNLRKTYHEGPLEVHVLRGVDLSVTRGERIAILGASGSGKSTLLNMLGGLDTPDSGSVTVAGQDLASVSEKQRGHIRNHNLGFVYQFHHLLHEFNALENVAMPLLIRGMDVAASEARALDYLTRVGLAERLSHKPGQLSGGERQRVAIARALVTQPDCVLLDEPTGNLDRHAAEDVHDLMLGLSQALNTSFIVVTHDQQLAKRMDRMFELEEGLLSART
jgi:lipoprotein-releasing system ATP-binding protein